MRIGLGLGVTLPRLASTGPMPPDIDWQYRGIHPDAMLYDRASLYSGANDAARTTAWRTVISSAITAAAGGAGPGTASPGSALYTDGHGADYFDINTTDIPLLDGFGWFRCKQDAAGTASAWTGQLWAGDFSEPVLWMRTQLAFSEGWDAGSGHKSLGLLLSGGRLGHEFSQDYIFQVGSATGVMNSAPTFFSSFPTPVAAGDVGPYDLHVAYQRIDSETLCLVVFMAPDGDEPVFLGRTFVMANAGTNALLPTMFMMGINRNNAPSSTQYLYYHGWQLIPTLDPWKLLDAHSVASFDQLTKAGWMEVTGVSGTVPVGGTGTLTLTGTNFPVGDDPYITPAFNRTSGLGETGLVRILNSTTMEVDVAADAGLTPGQYKITLAGRYAVQLGNNTTPATFEVTA